MGTLNNRFDVMVNMADVAGETSIFNGIVGLLSLVNRFDVMVNMPDVAHKTSIFNGIVGLIRRVKRRIRQLGTTA